MFDLLFWRSLANSLLSALTGIESAVIDPVAGVGLAEEPGMKRHNDNQLRATRCHLLYQMWLMNLVTQFFLDNKLS